MSKQSAEDRAFELAEKYYHKRFEYDNHETLFRCMEADVNKDAMFAVLNLEKLDDEGLKKRRDFVDK